MCGLGACMRACVGTWDLAAQPCVTFERVYIKEHAAASGDAVKPFNEAPPTPMQKESRRSCRIAEVEGIRRRFAAVRGWRMDGGFISAQTVAEGP